MLAVLSRLVFEEQGWCALGFQFLGSVATTAKSFEGFACFALSAIELIHV
jgi:hypothetical protein